MPWLIAFLVAHATAIEAVGVAVGTVAAMEHLATNTIELKDKIQEEKHHQGNDK